MAKQRCECEQETCHGKRSCKEEGTEMVLLCDSCCHVLPSEYHFDTCGCMKCEGA